jgi:hypothetical protein
MHRPRQPRLSEDRRKGRKHATLDLPHGATSRLYCRSAAVR